MNLSKQEFCGVFHRFPQATDRGGQRSGHWHCVYHSWFDGRGLRIYASDRVRKNYSKFIQSIHFISHFFHLQGWFQTPFSALGQSPEACSSLTFTRLMGPARANQMLLFNQKITTSEANQLGLVTKVLPDASFHAEVWPLLKQFSELPVNVIIYYFYKDIFCSFLINLQFFPQSLVYGKELTRTIDRDLLHKVNQMECDRLLERWQSEDCMEAIMKFFSKKSK